MLVPRSAARRSDGEVDATVVGAGPNGLAAAVTLARAGLRVRVFERAERPGGGSATAELTLPGFLHDVCSAIHPLAFESRFFREFGLKERVPFVTPELSFGHPLDRGAAGLAYRDLGRTREALGRDGRAYEALMRPLAERADRVADFTGSTLLRVPPDPVTAFLFALGSLEQGSPLWQRRFSEDAAPAMLTGVAAHTILPQPSLAGAGAGLALTAYAHARGWPVPVGGSQSIIDALVEDLRAHGGEVITGFDVTSLEELPPSRGDRARCHTAGIHPHRVAPNPARLSARARALPLRRRIGQGRLRAVRARSLDEPRTARSGHPAPRRHAGGDRGVRERGVAGQAQRLALRARRAAVAVRREPGACRAAHALDLHARAGRLDRRQAGSRHPADRALRAGLPRHDPGDLVAHRRWTWPATTRTTSAETSRPGRRTWCSSCAARCSAPTPGAPPSPACTCARRR